jgi:hypothetical protein
MYGSIHLGKIGAFDWAFSRRGGDVTDPFLYLKRAQELENKAAESQDPLQKSAYLQLAAAYRVLANTAAKKAKTKTDSLADLFRRTGLLLILTEPLTGCRSFSGRSRLPPFNILRRRRA